MKKLVFAGLMLASTVAMARKEDWVIRYQCQAKGSGKVVQGWQRDTVAAAKASAIQMCNSKGLSGCAIKACYQRITN